MLMINVAKEGTCTRTCMWYTQLTEMNFPVNVQSIYLNQFGYAPACMLASTSLKVLTGRLHSPEESIIL